MGIMKLFRVLCAAYSYFVLFPFALHSPSNNEQHEGGLTTMPAVEGQSADGGCGGGLINVVNAISLISQTPSLSLHHYSSGPCCHFPNH